MMERTCNNCRSRPHRVCHGCRDKSGWQPDYEALDARVAELEASIALLDKCFCLAVTELITSNPEACPPPKPVEEPFALQPPCNGECANCWREYLLRLAKETK